MVFRSLFYGSIPFHLSGADILCPLPEPLFRLFPALCSGADLCLRDRNTDGTGRNARHTRRIPVSDRVFRIRLLLFVLPEYQNSGQSPKKIILASPRFLLAYICCMTAILPAHFSGKKSRFPVLEACLRPLATWLSQPFASPVQGILSIRCIKKFTGWSFGKKRRGKWMRSQHGFIGASEKASEAFHSP